MRATGFAGIPWENSPNCQGVENLLGSASDLLFMDGSRVMNYFALIVGGTTGQHSGATVPGKGGLRDHREPVDLFYDKETTHFE